MAPSFQPLSRICSSSRLLLLALPLIAVMAPSRAAHAGAEYNRLARINDSLNAARLALPEAVGGVIAAEASAIAQLDQAVLLARHDLNDELRVEAAAYDEVAAGLADLEGWLAHLSQSHACNVARQAILRAHQEGRRAGTNDFVVFEAAVGRFAQGVRPAGSSDVSFYRAQLAKLRREDDEVEALSQKRATEEAARVKQARLSALIAEAHAKLAVVRQENATSQPISAGAVAALDEATRLLAAEEAEAAWFFQDQLQLARLELDWGKPTPDAETAIAAELGGSITLKGRVRGKSATLRGKARAGRCYVLLGRFDGSPAAESSPGVEWSAPPRAGALQELTIPAREGWSELAAYAFCATRNAAVTGKLTLSKRPEKGLRYVLVELGKESFPRALAAKLELAPVDHCDSQAWQELWTQPVPGTYAYVGGEPAVVQRLRPDGAVDYWTAGKAKAERAELVVLAAAVPDNVELKAPLEPLACPNNAELGKARSVASRKIVQCFANVERKVASRLRKVDKLRAAASKEGRAPTDADELAKLLDAERLEARASKCAPLEDAAKQQFERGYQSLSAALVSKRYQDPVARAAVLRAYARVALPRPAEAASPTP